MLTITITFRVLRLLNYFKWKIVHLTSSQTDKLIEEAAIAIAEADNILVNIVISEANIQILDNLDPMVPSAQSTNDDLYLMLTSPQTFNNVSLDEDILEEAIEEILNPYREISDTFSKTIIAESKNNTTVTTALITSETSTPCNSPSSSFSKHLTYPDPIKNKKGVTLLPENRSPMSISSAKWKEFYKNRERIKQEKRKEIEQRKKNRKILQDQKPKKKQRKKLMF